MNKSTQLIIGMLLGFEKGHEIYDGAEWGSDMASELLSAKAITKEDIFSLTANGKSIFQYKKTWENFDKLLKLADDNGETITLDDLQQVIVNDKTALQMAADCDATVHVFQPKLWVGNSDKMEDFWYSLVKGKRFGVDFQAVKDEVARLEGRTTREEQLKQAGIDLSTMQNAIKFGNLHNVLDKLAANGDHLRLEDAKLCDADGDHMLSVQTSWNHFDRLLDEWEKHGEKPDADFFLYRRGSRSSIVDSAFQFNSISRVFNERVFAGRPDELIRLYKQLNDVQQRKVEIEMVLTRVVENMCADMVQVDASLTLEGLTDVLYMPGDDMPDWKPVIGLGLKKTWDHIDDVADILKMQGQALSLQHLRLESGATGETCLIKAARFGKFDKVLAMLHENGERLELSDLLPKDDQSACVLDELIATDQLKTLLRPDMWTGRVGDLGKLWEKLPVAKQNEMRAEFKAAHTEANLLSLRALHNKPASPAPGLG